MLPRPLYFEGVKASEKDLGLAFVPPLCEKGKGLVPTPERGNQVGAVFSESAASLKERLRKMALTKMNLVAMLLVALSVLAGLAAQTSFPRSGVGTAGSHAGAWEPGRQAEQEKKPPKAADGGGR